MKKLIFLAAAATVAFASCTKNETIQQPLGQKMSFKNSLVTKATTLAAGEFNIIAYIDGVAPGSADYTTPKFTDTYKLDGDKYTTPQPDHMYYYNGTNSYWFYTYGDYATATIAKNPVGATYVSTAPAINFTATAGDVDLVTATTGEVAIADQTADKMLSFKHVLTKVRFTAKTDTYSSLALIKVKKIEYTVNANKGTVDMVNTPAVMDNATGAVTTYTIDMSAAPVSLPDLKAYVNLETAAKKVFYVVPQTLTSFTPPAAPAATDAYLKISWVVNDGATDGPLQTKSFPITQVLASNKQINYQITINLNMITFNAEMNDWDAEIPVPYVTPVP